MLKRLLKNLNERRPRNNCSSKPRQRQCTSGTSRAAPPSSFPENHTQHLIIEQPWLWTVDWNENASLQVWRRSPHPPMLHGAWAAENFIEWSRHSNWRQHNSSFSPWQPQFYFLLYDFDRSEYLTTSVKRAWKLSFPSYNKKKLENLKINKIFWAIREVRL